MRIRPAIEADLDCLAHLFAEAFDEPYTRPAVETLLAAGGAFALIAECGPDHAPCGFVIARVAADEAEILSLGVPPSARRRGIGRKLLAAVVEGLEPTITREIFLEVGADNRAARALYRSAGFETVGRRSNYYTRADRRRVDALIMRIAVKNLGRD